jgi:hypothetical protein
MDADNTQSTPVRAAGVTEDWLAGLETPGGIRGGPEAVVDAEDAHNGDGALEAVGSAGLGNGSSGGFARDPTAVEGAEKQAAAKGTSTRAGVPNYVPSEAVAAVWAYIAMSEYKAIQPMAEQLQRIAMEYGKKALQLSNMGKWKCSRTPEQSAALRTPAPQGIYNKAKKMMETITSSITPIWHNVKAENRSGWGNEDFIRETKLR